MEALANQIKPIVTKCISTQKFGVVISAGKNSRAVKVRVAGQEWHKRFKKHFHCHKDHLVSDPNNSAVEGDIVRISSGYRTSKIIKHVITAIVAPFGEPVENRPPVLSQAQVDELRVQKRLLKDVRRADRGRQVSIARLKEAKKQGLQIPTLEEAMEGTRLNDEMLKEREGGNDGPNKQIDKVKSMKSEKIEPKKKLKQATKSLEA